METALSVVAGKGGADVLDFMGYAVGRSVCDDCRPALNPMVKGWLYSLNPEFMKSGYSEQISYDAWVGEQKRKFGDNLSVTPMPERELADVNTVIETLEAAKQLAEDKEAEADEANAATDAANAEIKALTPFKKKAEELEAKLAKAEEKSKALANEVGELKEKLKAFDGKVAIDEKEIEKSVKDIVKRAVGAIAAAGGGLAAEGGDAAAGDDAGSSDGGVPDTFGFGASGNNDDGFGF
jgi:hypothetical protein